jgi:peptidoglycan hydrolase-like protein with peptidoglycan-binding domain
VGGVVAAVRAVTPQEQARAGRARTSNATPHLPPGGRELLALQRTAGNRAAAAMAGGVRTLARCQGGECKCGGACKKRKRNDGIGRAVAARLVLARQDRLTSPRFVGEPLLEDCFEDKARMGVGARDSGEHQPVSKLQQALLDWATPRRFALELGTTGPAGNGVDGVYGSRTAFAVRIFKTEEDLGSTEFGDVGPGTMHRLNELFPPGPTPPPPTPPPPTPPPSPDEQKIQQAKTDRDTQLRKVSGKLDEMTTHMLRHALAGPGEDVPPLEQKFPREVCVVQFWLHASPTDDDYLGTLTAARRLVERDRNSTQALINRTGADCIREPAHGYSKVGHPEAGTQLCNMWFDSDGQHCRSDVLIHETYHTLGAHKDGEHFPAERKPADAFDNADTMTQFGNDLIGLSIDNCGHTERSGTARTAIADCVAGRRPRP